MLIWSYFPFQYIYNISTPGIKLRSITYQQDRVERCPLQWYLFVSLVVMTMNSSLSKLREHRPDIFRLQPIEY